MSPYELVKERFKLPVELYPFQGDAVDELAPLERVGLYLDVGTGKTFTSIVICLWKLATGQISHVICLMPPILITNWSRTLAKIPGLTHTAYRGSPAKRKTLNLNTHFILMSYQVFKLDWDYLHEKFMNDSLAVLCDEAQALKNVGTSTHKKTRDFAAGNHLLLLTGTPLSIPIDGYAYIKLVAPTIYRNQLQFENIHVAKVDFFKKPTEWMNLDFLNENLRVNSVRVLKEDVLKDLPPVTYTELHYDMDPKHKRLYDELAANQLRVFEDGTKLDLTNVSALFNAMQQVPSNAEHFSGGEIESTIYELIDEIMDELAGGKLVIFTKYKMTNRRMLEKMTKYGVVALFSDITQAQQQRNIDTFVNDPSCRMVVLQYQSGGAGIDNLQHASQDILFMELPPTAAHFTQAVARVHRSGQKGNVNVRIAIAEKTIQHYCWDMVQDKHDLVELCIRGPGSLRSIVLGEYR